MLRLIYRDLFIYQKRNLILLPGFALMFIYLSKVSGAATPGLGMILIMISILSLTMTAYTAFAFDESNKFNRFLRSMPVPYTTIVLSRYSAGLLSSLMGSLYVILFAILSNLLFADKPSLKTEVSLPADAFFLLIIVLSLYSAILMTVLFKFGYTKTRYALLLVFVAIPATAPMLFAQKNINQALTSFTGKGGIFLLMLLSLLILLLSALLSTTIIEKKEEF